MKISKAKAIQLIDQKISQFEKVRAHYRLKYLSEAYNVAYMGTLNLLAELFSEEEMVNFREVTGASLDLVLEEHDQNMGHEYFRGHLDSCIAKLKVYKEKIQYFWPEQVEMLPTAKKVSHSEILPFVSMSFDVADKDHNEYVTGILKALRIKFETGERYSKKSIPEKVQSRIRDSDLFIAIFVKRDKIESGGYTTPSWLLKELGIAQGAQKDVIAWVERGIKDIAGLNYEKEVIYFDRQDVKEIQRATIKFLEALREHGLV
ncbi:hypothetical protein C5S31_07905 [ANME-1 cluster archaeon GoMg2]|nr:hypothetical protein [ANME-1 cluster archaeon GoMg2]